LTYPEQVLNGTSLKRGDLDSAFLVVAEAAAWRGPTPFPLEMVEELLRLMRADRGGYYEFQQGVRPNIHSVEQPLIDWEVHAAAANETISSWPLRDPTASPRGETLKLSDFLTRAERRRNPYHQAVSRPLDVEDELKIRLPAPRERVRSFFFVRDASRPDFGERERQLADLLAPTLALLRDRWEQLDQPQGLTPRERDVMRLVSQGLTNPQIARSLSVSTGTVRAHLENIYAKLQVHTRGAAVAALAAQPGTNRRP
jgi:DNA-binding CsgD family transcriptional regulator